MELEPERTASGLKELPNEDSVSVEVLEKAAKPPPGMISRLRVNGAETVVVDGSTAFAVLVVAPEPPLIDAPPEVYINAAPAEEPETLKDEMVIVPEEVADCVSDTPVAD